MCGEINSEGTESKSILNGQPEVFEQLFRKYYQVLCNYCQGIIGDNSKAEDIVQDVFACLWKDRQRIEIRVSLKSYLYQSVRNGALKFLRSREIEKRHTPLLSEYIEDLQQTEYSEVEVAEVENVKQILSGLPDQCRKVFLMSCLEEKSYKQIARELDISHNTVKTHIRKAYRLIRESIGGIKSLPVLLWSFWKKCL